MQIADQLSFLFNSDAIVTPLMRASVPLTATVEPDPITEKIIKPFDLSVDAPSKFYPWLLPGDLPDDWGLGVIVGASGSGKSKLLAEFGAEAEVEWRRGYSIASHFASPEDAIDRFYAVGLNSVPTWRLPYAALSNGQQFRADLARRIGTGAVVDEFTSVVDRNVAVAASRALAAWVKRNNIRRMVLASCHRDVLEWLTPDWIIDTDAGQLVVGEMPTADRQWWAEYLKDDSPVGRLVLS